MHAPPRPLIILLADAICESARVRSTQNSNGTTFIHLPPCGGGRRRAKRVGGWGVLSVIIDTPHPPNVVSARRHSTTSPTRGEVVGGWLSLVTLTTVNNPSTFPISNSQCLPSSASIIWSKTTTWGQ